MRPDGASLDAPALAANSAATARVGPASAAEVSITIGPGQAPARRPSTARNAALIRGEVDVPMWMMDYFTTSAAVKKGAGQSTQAHVKLIAREGWFSMIVVIKRRHGSLMRNLINNCSMIGLNVIVLPSCANFWAICGVVIA